MLSFKTLTIADMMFIASTIAMIYFTYHCVEKFSPQDFGIGIAAIFGGKGAHAWGDSNNNKDGVQ
jgi:hypothetical protein